MDPKTQVANIEVKQCFVLLERMELDKSKCKKRYFSSNHMNSYSERKLHNCIVCEKSFETYQSYRKHVRIHIKGRPYCCTDCGASFPVPRELRRHIHYRHTQEKPYHCTECDYACVEFSKLKRHMQCHTDGHPYKRPFRVSASSDMLKLKHHLTVHTGEKSYECDICQAQFTQSRSLEAHKIIHSKSKPSFPCDFCPLISRRKADLRSHILKLHSNDKPVKCKLCENTLPDRYSYKLHLKTHAGEKCFKCDFCPYACVGQYYLKKHMSKHTGEKAFSSDECDKGFRGKQTPKKHKNLHHDPKNSAPSLKEKTNKISMHEKAFCHEGMKLVNQDLNLEKEQHIIKIEKIDVDEFNDDESDSSNLLKLECSSSVEKIKSEKEMKLINQDLNIEKEQNIVKVEKIDFNDDESDSLNLHTFECSSSKGKIKFRKGMTLANRDFNIEKESSIIIIENIEVDEIDDDESDPSNLQHLNVHQTGEK